ncbi:hypothetical protein CSPX01_16016 [Colletotrichum filicis]|nr:hypothetical protein CSPX01_16016 [Colletotrichum filicis]
MLGIGGKKSATSKQDSWALVLIWADEQCTTGCLCYPSSGLLTETLQYEGPVPSQVWTYRYSNGARISMVDLRSSHNHGNLHKVSETKGGTVVHLSIYFLMNTYATSGIRQRLTHDIYDALETGEYLESWFTILKGFRLATSKKVNAFKEFLAKRSGQTLIEENLHAICTKKDKVLLPHRYDQTRYEHHFDINDEESIEGLTSMATASFHDIVVSEAICAAHIPDIVAKIDQAIEKTLRLLRTAVPAALLRGDCACTTMFKGVGGLPLAAGERFCKSRPRRKAVHREVSDLIPLVYALAVDVHMHRMNHLSKYRSRIEEIMESTSFIWPELQRLSKTMILSLTDSVELQYISEDDDDPKGLWA